MPEFNKEGNTTAALLKELIRVKNKLEENIPINDLDKNLDSLNELDGILTKMWEYI